MTIVAADGDVLTIIANATRRSRARIVRMEHDALADAGSAAAACPRAASAPAAMGGATA